MPDRLDDRLVIDACNGHMDGDLVRARRNIEGLLDAIAFVQALDDIAAVVEHETVAPLAIVALFQDQRAVFGLDHMSPSTMPDCPLLSTSQMSSASTFTGLPSLSFSSVKSLATDGGRMTS